MSEYGHFTTMRWEPDGVRGWSRHLDRLRRDGARMFDAPASAEDVVAALPGAPDRPLTLRIAVVAEPDLAAPGTTPPRVVATTRPSSSPGPLRLRTAPHRRALPEVKHLGITPELEVRRRVLASGYDDALFVDSGRVMEGPTWSMLLVSGSRLVVPTGGLPSVTISLLADLRPIEEDEVTDLTAFEAAAAVNAGWGIRSIRSVDDMVLAESPVLQDLAADYAALPRELPTAGT